MEISRLRQRTARQRERDVTRSTGREERQRSGLLSGLCLLLLWAFAWIVVSFLPALVLAVITFGLLSFLFVGPGSWYLYRMGKGLLRLFDRRPMPA